MKRPSVKVEKRDIVGNKLKILRRQGIMPANIYGRDIASTSVQLPLKEFQAMYKEVGSSGLLDVVLDGKARPVLIHDVHYQSLTHLPLHADFYQVNLKEKVKTMVPLIIVGESPAVNGKVGLLMQSLSEIEVEALPADLPENVEVSIENLAAVGDQIVVSDLKTPNAVTITSEPSQIVVKIAELVSEEAKEQAAEEKEAAEQAAEEGSQETQANAEAVKQESEENASE